MFIYYEHRAREVGPAHLSFSAKLPFNVVQSYYNYVEQLGLDGDEFEQVRAGNALALID